MKIILSLSGGLDSMVLLWYLLNEGHQVRCLSVDYGQRHRKELQAARAICEYANVEGHQADLRHLQPLLAGSSQTSLEMSVPEGHYAEESMKQTVVPNRNMLLLALAGAWAISTKSDAIAYAAHAGDHAIYPDCRPEFAAAMAVALNLCDWRSIRLLRPFIDPPQTKADLVRLGKRLDTPFHLTWSCYQGGAVHCGRCGTCVERREAFQLADVPDPTEYQKGKD